MEVITFEPDSDINTNRCIKCNENIEDFDEIFAELHEKYK